MSPLRPLPATAEALRELGQDDDHATARRLEQLSRAVQLVVPEIVGLSLAYTEEGLTFTMLATLEPVERGDDLPSDQDRAPLAGAGCHSPGSTPDDEEQWQLLAQTTAAAGIGSTLSLPLVRNGLVHASVFLYGSSSDAFDGRHCEIAAMCGARSGAAVINADLGFTTRFDAAEAPQRLREERLVDHAIGVLMSCADLGAVEAEGRLRASAADAGMTVGQASRVVLDLLQEPRRS